MAKGPKAPIKEKKRREKKNQNEKRKKRNQKKSRKNETRRKTRKAFDTCTDPYLSAGVRRFPKVCVDCLHVSGQPLTLPFAPTPLPPPPYARQTKVKNSELRGKKITDVGGTFEERFFETSVIR